MDLAYLTSLLVFTISVTITPGPNNLMLTASGLNFGFQRTLPHLLGIIFGFQTVCLLLAGGLGVVFKTWPYIHEVMKILGAGYLLYLAWKIARSGQVSGDYAREKPMTFWQAAFFQYVNPKAWSMCVTGLSAFTLTGDWLIPSVLAVSGAFLLAAFPCCSFWALLGSRVRQILKTPRQVRWFNYSLAGLTAASVALIVH